jgi:hypothetical protein
MALVQELLQAAGCTHTLKVLSHEAVCEIKLLSCTPLTFRIPS